MHRFHALALLAVSMVACFGGFEGVTSENTGGAGSSGSNGGAGATGNSSPVVELVAKDPLRRTYDFLRSAHGGILQDGEIKNAGSHIDFSSYNADALTVGIQGGEIGAIVDLGDDEAVATSIGTPGGGQGFAGLTLVNGAFNMEAANKLFELSATNTESTSDHAPVIVGHIYALRVIDTNSGKLDLVVKLLVTDFAPQERVSFRWAKLSGTKNP